MEVPFALSIHKFVNSVGADAGFAAFIGIALLAILYFAQARETASVRDRLDEAHERIAGLEARIGQLMHLQSSRQPVAAPAPGRVPAPVTPAPASVRPMGSAIASVRRVPTATPGAVAGAAVAAGPRPAAPVGMGAPALASATKLIPDPVVSEDLGSAADDTMLVRPAAAASGNGHAEAATAVNAAVPPRVQIRSGAAAAAGAGAAAGSAGGRPAAGSPPQVRRIGGTGDAGAAAPGSRARAEQRFEAFEPEGGRRLRGRLVPIVVVVVALIVIVAGVVVITHNSGGGTAVVHKSGTSTSTSNGTSTSASSGKKHPKAPAFKASGVTVAVLNSTAVSNLAADVGKALANQGYKQGSITNGATQTQSTTVVYYMPGYKVAAQHVASALKLAPSSVQVASQSAIQSCATTPAGATTSCTGNVIVSVGSDRASLASASGSTSAG